MGWARGVVVYWLGRVHSVGTHRGLSGPGSDGSMSNPNRFVPYTNFNAGGFVHSTTTGWDNSWKDPISTGCTAPPNGSSVTQGWPKSQLHPPTPTVAVSAAARSGALP